MGINDDLKDWIQIGFERLIARLDRIERHLEKMSIKEKLLEGERLLDNQDVCQLLNVSKRTLQRYRSSGELPYQMLYHKTFYKESDVQVFIKANFAKGENREDEKPDDIGNEDADSDPPKDAEDDIEETGNE